MTFDEPEATSEDQELVHRYLAFAAAASTRAAAEDARALRASELAESGRTTLRDLHLSVADLHRRVGDRHRASARLYHSFAIQLADPGGVLCLGRLLTNSVAVCLGVEHAAVRLQGDGVTTLESAGTAGLGERAQDLEWVCAEGPLLAATANGARIDADLEEMRRRWPRYAAEAADLGLTSVSVVPLTVKGRGIGAAGVFNAGPVFATALPLDGLAAEFAGIVVHSARALDERGRTGSLDSDGSSVVRRAAAVVAIRAGCDLPAALSMIRARAFVDSCTTVEIAHRVLRGDLSLD